ncbi:hypothetical protein Tco_1043786 [Tanacetum coccineum]|uniref:Uncharacterized protein n=1 Tax=Tanacetum coccineum TaxID=301880 RepID=A0ABQ5GN38_9ASTR
MILAQNHQVDTYDECEQALDIDDSDLRLTPVVRPNNNPHIVPEITTTTQTLFSSQNNQVDNCVVKPIRIIPGRAGIFQMAKLHKLVDTREGGEESVMSTQDYIIKVIEDVDEDDDFTLFREHVSILAKDKGFGQEMHQSEESKALYGVTSPKDYAVTYSNERIEKHDEREVSSDEDVDKWLNEELSKCMTGEDKEEEEEDALIDILKTVVEECKSVYKKAQIRTPSSGTSEIQGVSFVGEEEGRDISETLPYQQPSNEINPGSFTLPCTIGNLKIYATADVGAGINMMPKSLFEHLKLANLKKTNMAINMVIDTLETILLSRPFLAKIHAQIDVFRGEISLGVGNEKVKFDMNGEICHSRVLLENIYMVSSIQESEYVNPHEIENDDSSVLGQRTFHSSEESVGIVDSSSDSQENEVGSHLSEIVSRWHVCKPVHITFKNVEGNGMKFDDFLKVRYGNKNIDDVKEDFNFGVNIGRTKDDPYSRNFDVGIKRLFEAVWKLLLLSAAGIKVNAAGYNC